MKERKVGFLLNGFVMLLFIVVLLAAGTAIIAVSPDAGFNIACGVILWLVGLILMTGFLIVQPNQSSVVIFFGKYMGTVRNSGFYATVPFATHKKVSLRVLNFNSAKLKVNDTKGNPIEIAAVIVYKVIDTVKCTFDVEKYEQFVAIQSESALRHVAARYPYDNYDGATSLRGNPEEVADTLVKELQEKLDIAGISVMEARLTHLAYAPEIASAMLQRQQAEAILAAREKIVEGAVSIVSSAIERFAKESGIALDDERKVAMVNNLLVAVISERGAQPIINAGTIY